MLVMLLRLMIELMMTIVTDVLLVKSFFENLHVLRGFSCNHPKSPRSNVLCRPCDHHDAILSIKLKMKKTKSECIRSNLKDLQRCNRQDRTAESADIAENEERRRC